MEHGTFMTSIGVFPEGQVKLFRGFSDALLQPEA